jgi:plasmid stabilization system protein ParE
LVKSHLSPKALKLREQAYQAAAKRHPAQAKRLLRAARAAKLAAAVVEKGLGPAS